MNALVFPFTWISPAQLSALEAFFPAPTVLAPSETGILPPMARWRDAGRIKLSMPVRGDGTRIERLLDEYRRWADVHRGADISLSRIFEEKIPFFDDSHVAQIRSEIRRGPSSGGTDPGPALRLTRARLFLLMAQDFDCQSREIEQDLETLQGLESAMLTTLRDSEDRRATEAAAGASSAGPADPGAFMTEERLRAWGRLFLAGEPVLPSTPMATLSRAALETLLESAPDPQAVRSTPVAAGGGRFLKETAEALVCGRPPAPGDAGADRPQLTLFHVPGVGPFRMWRRLLKTPDEAGDDVGADEDTGTLLALVAA